MFDPERRAFLVSLIGEEKVKELEHETEWKRDYVMALGIESKQLGGSGELLEPMLKSMMQSVFGERKVKALEKRTQLKAVQSQDNMEPEMRKWLVDCLGEEWVQRIERERFAMRDTLKSLTGLPDGEPYDSILNKAGEVYQQAYLYFLNSHLLKARSKEIDDQLAELNMKVSQIEKRRALATGEKTKSVTVYRSGVNGRGPRYKNLA